jgi:hypothetical protein
MPIDVKDRCSQNPSRPAWWQLRTTSVADDPNHWLAAAISRANRFRSRAGRVYVALDRDATDRAIALARTFGTRGRVLIPPEDLGPKGNLNDWLRVGADGDPATVRSILERALAASPTPWALQIQRLPLNLAPWDVEDYPGARDLLCEVGHHGALSRDAHLRLLAERCGVMLATLQEAARELAQRVETEP